MANTLQDQIKQLKQLMTEMESQRRSLGDAAIEAALAPLTQKLIELEAQLPKAGQFPSRLPERQRKQVTLLFLDVVGSTQMTQHLDPEDALEIMDQALARLSVSIPAHGGRVTRFMGDGFKAIFGDPQAYEDDPEQAIRAGLEILESARAMESQLEQQWQIQGFQVRVGINTGLVALGGITEAGDTVMGAPVNLAARIESAAPPDCVLISHETYRHVRGLFEVEAQPAIRAKGFPDPVLVYVVKNARPHSFRIHARGVEGIETRMVGRDQELQTLQKALSTTIAGGSGELFTILGEAGVGKSRLLYEFQNWVDLLSTKIVHFVGRAHRETQGQPLSLFREVFTFHFQIKDQDSVELVRQKIETGVCQLFGDDDEGRMRSHFIGQLLGFDFSGSPYLREATNDAQQLRSRGMRYLNEYFLRNSRSHPILLFLEDLHWADDSSLDAITQLAELTSQAALLILCLARPTLLEKRPKWGQNLAHHQLVNLEPLTSYQSQQLCNDILRLVPLIPAELRDLIVVGAEGNPFYIEELIKMLIEKGVILKGEDLWQFASGRLQEIEIPPTLVGVLQARLETLSSDQKIVIQQASVIGRVFWDSTLEYINAAAQFVGEVAQPLDQLRQKELIFRREESSITSAREHIFKHAILRDVTYQSVIKRIKPVYHSLAADWLINRSGNRIGEFASMIAEHLIAADRTALAVGYLFQAGNYAAERYANEEAIQSYQRAINLLDSLPEVEIEPMHESELAVKLLSSLGDLYFRIGKVEGARQAFLRALTAIPKLRVYWQVSLHRKLGNTWREHRNYDEAIKSYEIADAFIQPNKDLVSAEIRHEWIENRMDWAIIYYYQADWAKMLEIFEITQPFVEQFGTEYERYILASNITRMHLRRDRYVVSDETVVVREVMLKHSLEYGNTMVIADAYFGQGFVHLWRGEYQEAEAALMQALELTERTGHAVTKTRVLAYLCTLTRRQRRVQETKSYIDQCLEQAQPIGMYEYTGTALANRAWVSWFEGHYAQTRAFARQALQLWGAMALKFPFQWTAIFPLLAVSHPREDSQEMLEILAKVLDYSQMILPLEVTQAVEGTLQAITAEDYAQALTEQEKLIDTCCGYDLL